MPNPDWLERLVERAAAASSDVLSEHATVSGQFDRQSLTCLVERDIRSFVLPFRRDLAVIPDGHGACSRQEYRFLARFVSCRAARITAYLIEAAEAANAVLQPPAPPSVSFEFLAGDSHGGGARPLLIRSEETQLVFKRTDPRPYALLAEVIALIESAIGSGIRYPVLRSVRGDTTWQVLPYLQQDLRRAPRDAEPFMFRLGMVTAVAYFLGLIDVHFENLVVHDEMPIIIDPECMFSGLDTDHFDPLIRLASTGCVTLHPRMSSITGDTGMIEHIDRHVTDDGRIGYMRNKSCTAHRLTLAGGATADPKAHAAILGAGFRRALCELDRQRGHIRELCMSEHYRGMRTRYIYRPTAHYKCYLELLFTPARIAPDIVHRVLLDDLAKLPPVDPNDCVRAGASEAHDLLSGDIPYFHLAGDAGCVMHETGPVSDSHARFKLSRRVQMAIDRFSWTDFPLLGGAVDHFLQTGRLRQ